MKRRSSSYKRGDHPNSRRNLQPFNAGGDPRRWRGGARTRDRQRELSFLAVAEALRSELLSDEAREALLKQIVQEVLRGALAGDRVLLHRVFDYAIRHDL